MVEDLLEKLEKKNGYFELQINTIDELLDLIRPERKVIPDLMKTLTHKFFSEKSPSSDDNEIILYRGMADDNWQLDSSYSRLIGVLKDENDILRISARSRENQLLKFFQKACDLGAVQLPNDSVALRKAQDAVCKETIELGDVDNWIDDSYTELVAFAQHYGVPTRFLDWTSHPLVAAYFAVSGVFSEDPKGREIKNFSIWAFNTTHIDLLPPEVKIVTVPTSINSHAANQHGCFTMVSKQDLDDMYDDYPKLNDCFEYHNTPWRLLKLKIDAKFARNLFDFCDAYNFNATYLFRGPHGAAKHAKDLWNRYTYGTFSNNKGA